MSVVLGCGDYRFHELDDWAQLPADYAFHEAPDVAVDAADRVYVLSRSEHPVMIFQPDGAFVASFGEDQFVRPHGLTFAPDGTLWIADDMGHCIFHCTAQGEILGTLGMPGQPAPRLSGRPFNQPTKLAVCPNTGALYVADGYGNARVHKYAPDGQYLLSWGDFGVEAGHFNLVHSVCTDGDGKVYVADRESHRVQVFDGGGNYLGQWNHLHRPCGLHILGDRAYVGQLLTHLAVNQEYPKLGACVTIHDLSGKQLARLGADYPGEAPGQFTAPHGLAVDSKGDLYVAEVSLSAYGKYLDPPREARCLRKLVRLG